MTKARAKAKARRRVHGATAEARFLAMIDRPGGDDEGECWRWTGAVDNRGRGLFRDGKMVSAPRWAWAHWRGTIPAEAFVRQLCGATLCVNPAHLQLDRRGRAAAQLGGLTPYGQRVYAHLRRGDRAAAQAEMERGPQEGERQREEATHGERMMAVLAAAREHGLDYRTLWNECAPMWEGEALIDYDPEAEAAEAARWAAYDREREATRARLAALPPGPGREAARAERWRVAEERREAAEQEAAGLINPRTGRPARPGYEGRRAVEDEGGGLVLASV